LQESVIRAEDHHRLPRGSEGRKDHPDDAKRFFHEVARALDRADEILVVGPSTAKIEFVKYMHKNDHARDPRILGVETIDHPSDARLAAYARLYFKARAGRLRSGSGS
jgi:stalled ribosome rescue protein Dom34